MMGWRAWGLLAAGLLIEVIALTWPLVRHLGVHMPGYMWDQPAYVWAIDTFWTNVVAGRSPLWTDRIMYGYPAGVNLLHSNAGQPTLALFAGPFWATGTLPLFCGLLVLLAPVVGGLGMARAVERWTGRADAGAWTGALYVAVPAFASTLASPYYCMTLALALLPWGWVALDVLLRDPGARGVYAVTLVSWLLFGADYYLFVGWLTLGGCVALARVERTSWKRIAAVFLLNAGLLVVLWCAVGGHLSPHDLRPAGDGWWVGAAANLRDYFAPNTTGEQRAAQWWSPLWARWLPPAVRPGPDPGSYFLGICAPLLVVWALVGRSRVVLGLAAACMLSVALSAGSIVSWGSTVLLDHGVAPFWLMVTRVPWLQALDSPRRFTLIASVAWVALLGCGLARLRSRYVVALAAAVVLLVDYGQGGIPLGDIPPAPRVYLHLATRPPGTLLEVPSGLTESKGGFGISFDNQDNGWALFWQTVHRKVRVAGFLSRIPTAMYEWAFHEPVLGDLLVWSSDGRYWACIGGEGGGARKLTTLPDYPPEVVQDFVRRLDLRYVILRPTRRQGEFVEGLRRLFTPLRITEGAIDGYYYFEIARDT